MKALILSGGTLHPYNEERSLKVKEILEQVNIQSVITEDLNFLASSQLKDFNIIIINCVYCTHERWPGQEKDPNWHYEFSEASRNGVLKHLHSGKGLLALHGATVCFDDWPEYKKILGAWWEWGGKCGHSPYQEHQMKVRVDSHPIVAGLSNFSILDELYYCPQITDKVESFITAEWEGVEHPILWVRLYGEARVCYCALGHDGKSFENRTFQVLLKRSALWVTKELKKGNAQ